MFDTLSVFLRMYMLSHSSRQKDTQARAREEEVRRRRNHRGEAQPGQAKAKAAGGAGKGGGGPAGGPGKRRKRSRAGRARVEPAEVGRGDASRQADFSFSCLRDAVYKQSKTFFSSHSNVWSLTVDMYANRPRKIATSGRLKRYLD